MALNHPERLVMDKAAAPHDRIIRIALWSTVALNAVGTAIFTVPALGGTSAFLPVETPRFFAAQLGFVIALFCGVYAWLALQAQVNRAVVVVGALGKLGFFGLTLAYAVAGDVPVRMAVNATPDLLLAVVFLWWARTSG